MTVYTCEDHLEAMLTCIYDAWEERLGHQNIRFEVEPVFQQELFCRYVHIEGNPEKAEKVIRSIQKKISMEAWRQVYMAAMSCERRKVDVIYRFLRLGFACGRRVTEMLTADPVMELMKLNRQTGNEMHYFLEFTRFTSVAGNVYVGHIEPKSDVLTMVAEHFADRMPSERWLLLDDNRGTAAVHPENQPFYITVLTEQEQKQLRETERQEDIYTGLWCEFFDVIGIEARRNPKCQLNRMPLWYRKHVTEFLQ